LRTELRTELRAEFAVIAVIAVIATPFILPLHPLPVLFPFLPVTSCQFPLRPPADPDPHWLGPVTGEVIGFDSRKIFHWDSKSPGEGILPVGTGP